MTIPLFRFAVLNVVSSQTFPAGKETLIFPLVGKTQENAIILTQTGREHDNNVFFSTTGYNIERTKCTLIAV